MVRFEYSDPAPGFAVRGDLLAVERGEHRRRRRDLRAFTLAVLVVPGYLIWSSSS